MQEDRGDQGDQEDERCCGAGTCIIDALGHCWCGQQWDGTKMCRPTSDGASITAHMPQPPYKADNANSLADIP